MIEEVISVGCKILSFLFAVFLVLAIGSAILYVIAFGVIWKLIGLL